MTVGELPSISICRAKSVCVMDISSEFSTGRFDMLPCSFECQLFPSDWKLTQPNLPRTSWLSPITHTNLLQFPEEGDEKKTNAFPTPTRLLRPISAASCSLAFSINLFLRMKELTNLSRFRSDSVPFVPLETSTYFPGPC